MGVWWVCGCVCGVGVVGVGVWVWGSGLWVSGWRVGGWLFSTTFFHAHTLVLNESKSPD